MFYFYARNLENRRNASHVTERSRAFTSRPVADGNDVAQIYFIPCLTEFPAGGGDADWSG